MCVPNTRCRLPDTLTTQRLLMRRFRVSDAIAFHAILSDAQAMRFWSTLPHRELAETEDWIRRTIAGIEAGEADDFVVLHQGQIVGKAGFWHGNEIGMVFAPGSWGHGFAGEAVRAILARAGERGMTSVRADVDPRNERSLRLLAKLGFIETGRAKATLQIGEEWVDSVYLEFKLLGAEGARPAEQE
jgi:[ribosomal protein S5]-alanine N-acetyltransferase